MSTVSLVAVKGAELLPESVEPRTLLEAMVRQRQLSWDEAAELVVRTARQYEDISLSLSGRHLGRLARGERSGCRPNPATRRALQYTFDRPVDQLLAPYTPGGRCATPEPERDSEPSKVLIVAADRARRFMTSLQTLSDESLQLVHDDVRDLVRAYPARPLPEILGHLVSGQETVFSLLERPQRPTHARQLYFLSAVLGGLLAKASHDLADSHAALAQSRTAWMCAEQADHDGLRAWMCGLQSLISYWARRPHDSIRYAQRGAPYAERAGSTAMVWLPDELDELGGLAVFSRPRQWHFAADALVWLPEESTPAENYASQAAEAYSDPADPNWSFSSAAGSYAMLAIARIRHGELNGAAAALTPVLELPAEQRINGIVQSVNRVHRALNDAPSSVIARDLQERIELYTSIPVRALTR